MSWRERWAWTWEGTFFRVNVRRARRAKWPWHRIVWELFKSELSGRKPGWDDPSS